MQLQIQTQTGHARAVGKHGALGSKNDTFYKRHYQLVAWEQRVLDITNPHSSCSRDQAVPLLAAKLAQALGSDLHHDVRELRLSQWPLLLP